MSNYRGPPIIPIVRKPEAVMTSSMINLIREKKDEAQAKQDSASKFREQQLRLAQEAVDRKTFELTKKLEAIQKKSSSVKGKKVSRSIISDDDSSSSSSSSSSDSDSDDKAKKTAELLARKRLMYENLNKSKERKRSISEQLKNDAKLAKKIMKKEYTQAASSSSSSQYAAAAAAASYPYAAAASPHNYFTTQGSSKVQYLEYDEGEEEEEYSGLHSKATGKKNTKGSAEKKAKIINEDDAGDISELDLDSDTYDDDEDDDGEDLSGNYRPAAAASSSATAKSGGKKRSRSKKKSQPNIAKLKTVLGRMYKQTGSECEHLHANGVCKGPDTCPLNDPKCFLNPDVYSCIKDSIKPLRDHQIRCVIHMLNNDSLLAFHGTGTGKTLLGAATTKCCLDADPNMKAFIVTPTSLQGNFKKELLAYGMSKEFIEERYIFYTHTKFAQTFVNAAKREELVGHFLLIDESHNFRSRNSKEAKSVLRTAIKAKKLLLLSATPAYNAPSDVCISLAMLHRSTKIFPMDEFDGLVHMASVDKDQGAIDILKTLFRCRVSVHSELEPGMYPKVRPEVKIFVMSKDYAKAYESIEMAEIESYKKLFGEGNIKVFYNGLRRAANAKSLGDGDAKSPKLPWIIDYIKSRPAGTKGMVYSNFIQMGNQQLVSDLTASGIKHSFIQGKLTAKKRDEIVKEFNTGAIDVLLGSPAASEGLDLKGAEYIIQMEPGWNEASSKQVEGRGARYKSHHHLPPERHFVDSIMLIVDKIGETRDVKDYTDEYEYDKMWEQEQKDGVPLPSIDHYLYRLQCKKAKDIRFFIQLIIPISIEKNSCMST